MVYTTFNALSNHIKIRSKLWVEKFSKNSNPLGVGIGYIGCESSSATKTRPFSEKIGGYVQFQILYKMAEKK